MKYSIVVGTYNHCQDLLKPCIEAIVKYTNLEDIELIIVANGCKDETREYLNYLESYFHRSTIGGFKQLYFEEPLGYALANNKGIEVATSDKIVLLNNDAFLIEQPKSTWLNLLDAPFSNPKCGISCVLTKHSEETKRNFAIFFCVMIKREVFDKIGLLSLDYGVGGSEDIEFCIEAENAGFEVTPCVKMTWNKEASMHIGNFPMYHRGEGTVFDKSLVPDWTNIFYQNTLKLAKKYNPDWIGLKDYKRDLAFLKNDIDNFYDEVVCGDEYKITTDNQMKDRNVLDIGANIGSFSVLAAYFGAKKVVSVEPVTSVHAMLLDNSKNFPAILPLKRVVTDRIGELHKISLHDFSGVNSIYNVDFGNSEEVVSTNLSALLKHFDGDNIFLKCDCEGAEYDIILNATPEEMNRINRIVLEIHLEMHPLYKGSEIIENKLREFGFNLEVAHQIYHWNVDAQGNRFNCKEIPFKVEFWSKHA